MGCDIHALYERIDTQFDDYADSTATKWWVSAGEPSNTGRFYDFFGTLAGVRYSELPRAASTLLAVSGGGEFGPYFQASESWTALERYWGGEAHTHGWLGLKGVQDFIAAQLGQWPSEELMKHWTTMDGEMHFIMVQHHLQPDQVRLVFFFDN